MGTCNRHTLTLLLATLCAPLLVGQAMAQGDPCNTGLTAPGTRFWIPVIGHGTDPFGNQFDTVFKVISLQETAATFTIFTCGDTGEAANLLAPAGDGGPPVSSRQVTMAGKGIATLRSLNASPATKLDVGWATIDSGGNAIGVEVIFNIRDTAGFFTSTNVRVGVLHRSTTFFADIGPSVNTGVAFLYPPRTSAPQQTTADIVLRDDAGAVVTQTTITLDKAEKRALFLGQLLSPAGQAQDTAPGAAAFSGTVEVSVRPAPGAESSEFWSILPLRQEGLVLTTQVNFPARIDEAAAAEAPGVHRPAGANACLAPIPENGRAFFVPLVGHGTDPFGNRVGTVFKVINLSSRTADVRIVSCSDSGQMGSLLMPEAGAGSVSLIDFSVPGNGSKTLFSLNPSPSTSLDSGWALMTTLDFVGLEVIFNIVDSQNFLTSTNVQLTPIVTATAFFADIGPGLNTGVSIVYPAAQFLGNPGGDQAPPERAGVNLFLTDAQGQIIERVDIGLNRGEKTAQFLGEIINPAGQGMESFSGSLDIRADQPVAILPLRQEGLVLTTQALFPPRVIRGQSVP